MTCPASLATSRYGPDPNNHPDQKELSNIISNVDCGCDGNAPLFSAPMAAEDKARVEKDNEENKEIIQENIRKMESGELEPCGVAIRSDYDIGPK
ncbi:hypothetical protein CNMCM5878_002630 [Aspergillus fumigatiaffinis]|jgi:hypothetical protein|nr:hypothetical protein CNMCM5878_002630 [Aspergillus fumigatiaffinis]KAF4224184.1 hypothetical protein CNMCM6457_009706 [Aspergillus fumigatiaffinis]